MHPLNYLKVRRYGERLVEVTWNLQLVPKSTVKADRGASEEIEENQKRAILRARSSIRRKIINAGLTHLVTLTYRENVLDKERAKADFSRFVQSVHSERPEWKYLAVFERQSRGAWHVHIATAGFQDVNFLREKWLAVVGQGSLNARAPRQTKVKNARVAMANYLSKYIGKDVKAWKLNKKNYFHSKNVTEPEPEKVFVEIGEISIEDFARALVQAEGDEVQYEWIDPSGERGRVSSF